MLFQLLRKEAPTDFKRDLNSKKDNDLKDYLRSIRVRLNEIETTFSRDGEALTVAAVTLRTAELEYFFDTQFRRIETIWSTFD